jgi:hypothetical protein
MGKTLNIVWSVLTALLTLSTTGMMGVAVLTSHWEVITYSQSMIEAIITEAGGGGDGGPDAANNRSSVSQLLDGRVIVVTTDNQHELLVKMHSGLWATCYDLTGMMMAPSIKQVTFTYWTLCSALLISSRTELIWSNAALRFTQ